MAKQVAVVIREDPRKTHRPVEALRIALGLVAGDHHVSVVLLDEAVRLLSDDTDDVVDIDILEKYLPSIEQLEVPFIVETSTDRSLIGSGFTVRYEALDTIRTLVQTMDRTLVF
jgi:sulfur relay (sulfurtransferase) DsrF/TusC family protein